MKKSHIFHVDSLSILDKMTNEQAGEFIKSAYYYMVYGELPTCSFAIEMALAPFVNQWCRDAEKWTAVREKRIEAGAKGGKQKLANASKSKQETLVNVNVNDNVNDNVNGSVVYNISDTTHNLGLGIDYRKSYDSMNDEFKKLYEREVYNSYIDLMKKLHVECRFLAQWENQLTIYEFKKIYDRIISKEITSSEVRQALIDLDANKQAKDKYNSVAHGLNIYLKTIISRR